MSSYDNTTQKRYYKTWLGLYNNAPKTSDSNTITKDDRIRQMLRHCEFIKYDLIPDALSKADKTRYENELKSILRVLYEVGEK